MKTVEQGGRWLLWAVVSLVVLRLISLGLYPLMDTTEARYAEIGRKMVELGDWVTPWYDYGVPFWGKPPMSFWLTAISFRIFGINEFAARLPHLLAGLLVAWIVWGWAVQTGRTVAVYSMALLAGAVLFLISSGAVMTDMSLAIGTTLTMRGFWLGMFGAPEASRREGWLFFLGLAIGLLAKGPLIFVIAGVPIGLWTLFSGQLLNVWRTLPWVRGFLLVAALSVPWYVMAEQHTPGFLNYFIVGEHWHRFLTPGWKGDLYGNAHVSRRGTIWLLGLVACLPWTFILPLIAWRQKGEKRQLLSNDGPWIRYLLLWGLTPCVFFTFAGNILATYVLPGLPALALLGAYWLARQPQPGKVEKWLAGGLAFTAVLFVAVLLVINFSGKFEKQSAKALVMDYMSRRSGAEALVMMGDQTIYSPAFYTQGKLVRVNDAALLEQRLDQSAVFVALRPFQAAELPEALRQRLQPLATHGDYVLYGTRPKASGS